MVGRSSCRIFGRGAWSLLVLAVFLLLGLTPDQALAGNVGMCGDNAQSIDAPPPLYPSDAAYLGNGGVRDDACDSVDSRRSIDQAPAPTERPTQLQLEPRTDSVLFSPHIGCARASTEPLCFFEDTTVISEEHRDSPRRPPRV